MLKMTGVCKAYRFAALEVFALRNLSVVIREGEFVAVTGPSGSGKSTFLTVAGMLDRFSDGEYELDGVSVTDMCDQARSRLRREKIGFIFQAFNLLPDLTVADNVEMPLIYRGFDPTNRRRRVDSSLDRVGMLDRARSYPKELSGGQQQRVAIARALAGSPRILLADEPTANLNPEMASDIMGLIQDLHRDGVTILVVTHGEEMTRRAEREVRIVDGCIVPHPLLNGKHD